MFGDYGRNHPGIRDPPVYHRPGSPFPALVADPAIFTVLKRFLGRLVEPGIHGNNVNIYVGVQL